MPYLLLSILTTNLIILLFKLFERYKVNNFQAIVVNYLIAAAIGFIASQAKTNLHGLYEKPWFWIAICTGFLFISTFYLMAITVQKAGLSAATVASKMSLIIPVTVAFCIYGDEINSIKVIGIVLALMAVFFTSYKNNQRHMSWQLILLPLVVFIASGCVDGIINYAQKKLLEPSEFEIFFSVIMGSAGVMGLIALAIKSFRSKTEIHKESLVGGILLGILNIYSLIFLIKALDSKILEPSVLFPVNNLSVLMISTFPGILLFHEKLNKYNRIGILLAVIAILLLAQGKG
jgi:drug/metabolite transporter (DMT)-like permease